MANPERSHCRRPWRSGRVAMSAAWLALVSLAGCNDPKKPTAAPTSTTRSVPTTAGSTTSSVAEGPAAEIVARYQMFWQVRFEANRDPVNPADPRFGEYATGQQFDNIIKETTQRRDQGLALRRPQPSITERRVKVVELAGDSATLRDCATNDGVVYRVNTGEVVDDSVATYNVLSTMRRVDGLWKLDHTSVVQQWKGVAGCALSGEFTK